MKQKFEGLAREGEMIRGYDFRGVKDCYMQGTVVDAKNSDRGYQAYKIVVLKRVFDGKDCPEEVGDIAWIPHEVSRMDWDDRVIKVGG